MTAAQFCRLAARRADLAEPVRRAVDALAAGDGLEADRRAPPGTDGRRAADRFILDLHDAGVPVGPARPTAARTLALFAD